VTTPLVIEACTEFSALAQPACFCNAWLDVTSVTCWSGAVNHELYCACVLFSRVSSVYP